MDCQRESKFWQDSPTLPYTKLYIQCTSFSIPCTRLHWGTVSKCADNSLNVTTNMDYDILRKVQGRCLLPCLLYQRRYPTGALTQKSTSSSTDQTNIKECHPHSTRQSQLISAISSKMVYTMYNELNIQTSMNVIIWSKWVRRKY